MSNNGRILFNIAFFGLLLMSALTVLAQRNLPNQPELNIAKMPPPIIELVKYERDVKRGTKIMKAGITIAVKNWDKYSDNLFKPFNTTLVCSDANQDSRMILEVSDLIAKKLIYTDCAVDQSRLKSNTFYILPENQIPECIYATLTDRQTGKKVTGNSLVVKTGKPCITVIQDKEENPSVELVTPKKP